MDLNEAKERLRNHFTDGLVTIVGSGLSVAAGLPSMGDLSKHLLSELPVSADDGLGENWVAIRKDLEDGVGEILSTVVDDGFASRGDFLDAVDESHAANHVGQ